jgi:hypothetical protein
MSDNKNYDDMTPEEQAEHDRIAREKEAAEQAGKYIGEILSFFYRSKS